jgi:ABC-type uncharacterized transport system ATPase subunit
MSYAKIQATDVSIAVDGTTLIKEINLDVGDGELALTVTNTGAAAFDAFDIQVQVATGGPWVSIGNAAGDFTTPVLPLICVRGAPVTLAAAAVFFCQIDTKGINAVRVYASANTAVTTASMWSNLSRS